MDIGVPSQDGERIDIAVVGHKPSPRAKQRGRAVMEPQDLVCRYGSEPQPPQPAKLAVEPFWIDVVPVQSFLADPARDSVIAKDRVRASREPLHSAAEARLLTPARTKPPQRSGPSLDKGEGRAPASPAMVSEETAYVRAGLSTSHRTNRRSEVLVTATRLLSAHQRSSAHVRTRIAQVATRNRAQPGPPRRRPCPGAGVETQPPRATRHLRANRTATGYLR